MQEDYKNFELCMSVALNNAKQRINLLENHDKKSVFDEYKEWFNEGLNTHSVLILREDPII